MKKIGFIGFGNMAIALAEAFIKFGDVKNDNLFAYAPNQVKLKNNTERLEINLCKSLDELILKAEIIIIACKPYQIEEVFQNIKSLINGKIILSVAIGWDYKKISEILLMQTEIQYLMPNTPASVGEGVYIFESENSLESKNRVEIINLFKSMGCVIELPSRLMNVGSAISGCGPAFMDLLIEAIGDGGVKNGLDRENAYKLACYTMIGAAKLKLESKLHPGELKDRVCSPGGTTIKGIASLEESGVRSAFIKAIDAVVLPK